jgi:hypothetical protein
VGEGADKVDIEHRARASFDAGSVVADDESWRQSTGPTVVGDAPALTVDGEDVITATRAEIEETRAHMSETIDAIQEKLSPGHLVHEATSAVRDATIGRAQGAVNTAGAAAKGAGSGMADLVRQNPLPAAAVGVALGWLYFILRQRPTPQTDSSMQARSMAASQTGIGMQHSTEGAADKVKHAAGSVADQVQGAVSGASAQVQDAAGQMAGQVQSQLAGMTAQAQQRAQQAQFSLQQALHDRPLAIGAAAIAIGIAIGLAIPESPKEHELLGPAKDSLVDQAQSTVQDTMQQVQTIAQDALSAAKHAAAT